MTGPVTKFGLYMEIPSFTKLIESSIVKNWDRDALTDFKVKPGDVFFLPAGRIHAIGTGCFIAEIQQTSDITYRIYDYGRLGLDGKPRELHTELAKDAIDYKVYPEYKTAYEEKANEENRLVSCKYFTTTQLDIDKPFVKDLSGLDSFLVVICIEGSGELVDNEDGNEIRIPVRKGETVLVPASSKGVTFVPDGKAVFLTSCVE